MNGGPLAHVADHDLQFQEAVEHAAGNHADDMDGSLDVPVPGAAGQHL